MADPTTISGKLMFLYYRDAPGSAASQLVCLQDANYNGSRNLISDETNCGVLKDTGQASHQFTGTAVVDTVPDAGEASYLDLQTLFLNDTQKYWELSDENDVIFHGGYGKITQLGNQNSAAGGASKFTLTVEVTGTLDVTPTS